MTDHATARCHWAASDQPRMLRSHRTGCEAPGCEGCEECPEIHCGICGHAHVTDGLHCPACVGVVRDDIATIVTLAGDPLNEEATLRGVHSEAAMLTGPAADPETWGYRRQSAINGRIDGAWLDDCRDEPHPTWTLGTWDMLIREHLDQPTTLRVTLARAADYLTGHLTRLAADEGFAFEELARDVRVCRSRLETVLHDQARGDIANIGCFECGNPLERRLTDAGFEDHWTCSGCRRRYTYAEYNFALRANLETAQESA